MNMLRINGDRLWQSLMEMGEIGATKKGGCARLALTDLDKQAKDLFVKWCVEAGCIIHIDAVGNVYARRPGKNNDLPPICTGSHLDTQPTGGKFDGVYGVLSGVEVLRTLQDQNITTEAPIEVIVWSNEEGSRFPPAMMASGVVAGKFELQDILNKKDEHGLRYGDELERIGYAGVIEPGSRPIGMYFEAHIEQGPVLENSGDTIGVVTKCQGQRWYDMTVTGRESHAGTTPMHLRADALVAASRIVQHVETIAKEHGPFGCGTVGYMNVYPNSRNTIPGQVSFGVDLRHPEDTQLSSMDKMLLDFIDDEAFSHLDIELDPYWYCPPIDFSDECVETVRVAAKSFKYSSKEVCSGAGHDACYIAEISPAAMIFIPCEGGISHNEVENISQGHSTAGCNVLLNAMTEKAKVISNRSAPFG